MASPPTPAPDASPDPVLTLEDGVARLVFDHPHRPVNLLTFAALERLDARLAEVEALAAAERAAALVVGSGKPGSWIAGADLDELRRLPDAAEATARVLRAQQVLRRLERLPVPTFAALDGLCLGSGTELALACSYRLGADSPRTRLGLPQTRFGLIPGLGGTVRLPRLIGVQAALELILTGATVGAREAERLGLLDALLPEERFEGAVTDFVLDRLRRGRTRTGARRGVAKRLVEDTFPGRRLVFRRAAARLVPGPLEESVAARFALAAVAEGIALPLERAFEREAERLGELLASEGTRGLLHAFRLVQDAGRAPAGAARAVEHAAVIGAGRTGATLAHLLASAGVRVRLKDRGHGAVAGGVRQVHEWLRLEAEQGRISAREREERAARVDGGTGYGGFGAVDLAVVAVGEAPGAAAAALLEAEEHTREGCLLAGSAAGLALGEAQERAARPRDWLALSLAEPTDRFSLLEVVRGPATAPDALATLHGLARRAGRTPLLVADRPGRVLPRLLGVYFAEATRLLEDGAAVEEVDAAAEEFGLVAGPFRRMDALGTDRAARLLAALAPVCAERARPGPRLAALARGGGSFHAPRAARPRRGRAAPPPALPAEVLLWRLLLSLVNEAAHLLEEEVVRGAGEVDVAALTGLGFPRFRGGLLYFADAVGVDRIVQRLDEAADRLDERFRPAPLLRRLARDGARFYAPAPAPAPSGQPPRPVLS